MLAVLDAAGEKRAAAGTVSGRNRTLPQGAEEPPAAALALARRTPDHEKKKKTAAPGGPVTIRL